MEDINDEADIDITYGEDDVDDIVYEVKVDNMEDIHNFMKNYANNKKTYKTSNILSKYEKTKVLTERAQQIEEGCPPYIVNFERFTTSYSIAIEEMNQKKIPFIIRRSMPHSKEYEYWKLKDMIY